MGKKRPSFLPKHSRVLKQVGQQLKLARLRRKFSAAMVAERAGISRNTLYLLEKGSGSSSIGTLFQVLVVLGLEDDFLLLAKDDEFGRRLEDARLVSPRKRAPKRKAAD